MSTDTEHFLDINATFGAMLVGCLVACMLYGLTTLQAYCYFTFYPGDTLKTKLLILVIWLLDSAHTAIISYGTYHYLIVDNCQLSELRFTQWTIPSSVIIKTLISCTVQAYFTIKIVYLTPLRLRWWISCIIGTLITAHFAFAMETSVLMFIKKEWSKLGSINYHATAPFAVFAVISDIMIAASLMYFLHGQRSGMKRTDRVITKLIVYAANRSLVTSIVIIVEAIAFTKLHNTLWFLAIDFIIGKLYANSLLATLNCRCFVGRLDRNRTIHTTMRFSPFGGDLSTSPADDDYDDQIELEIKTGENDKRKSREVTSSTRGAIAIDIPLTFVNQRPKHPENDNHSPC